MTHVPIEPGDKCVLVVMNDYFTEQFRKGNHRIVHFDDTESYHHVEAIHHGTYNDYGWIEEVDNPKAPDDHGVDRPLSLRRVTIFLHEKVWQEAVKAGMKEAKKWEQYKLAECERRKNSLFGAPKKPTQDDVEFRAVSEVAYWTRRDLLVCERFHGCQTLGSQHYDTVHALTQEMWGRWKNRSDEE